MSLFKIIFVGGFPYSTVILLSLGLMNVLLHKMLYKLDNTYNEAWKVYLNSFHLWYGLIFLVVMIGGYVIFKFDLTYVGAILPLPFVLDKVILMHRIKKEEL